MDVIDNFMNWLMVDEPKTPFKWFLFAVLFHIVLYLMIAVPTFLVIFPVHIIKKLRKKIKKDEIKEEE